MFLQSQYLHMACFNARCIFETKAGCFISFCNNFTPTYTRKTACCLCQAAEDTLLPGVWCEPLIDLLGQTLQALNLS